MSEAENQINDVEYKNQKTTNQNNKKKTIQTNKDSVNRIWDNFKRSNIRIIRVPEGE